MAPFESTDHGFINSSDDIEEGTTNQFFTQARAHASFSVTNTISPTYNGVTYLFGGLNLTNGTITYIPPPPVELTPYATLANPAFTGTPTVGGTAIKVNVGDGALTEKNFTSALNTKLGGIAENADVTPSLAAYATLASPAFTGAPTINGADFPKSKVYGTCYLGHNAYVNIAGNFTGQYANVNDGRWVQDFASHNTLFNLSSNAGLIRFPRAGVYQINASIRILAAAEVFYISLDLDTGNGTYTQYSTVGHQGQGGDDAYVVTLTANPIINVTNTTTNMKIMARAHQGNPRRIEPQVDGNTAYQKSSIISVHNVD